MKYLEHEFLEGLTYGPDGDYTDLKCEICGLEVYLDNYSNRIRHDGICLSPDELESCALTTSCKEYQIKKLLE